MVKTIVLTIGCHSLVSVMPSPEPGRYSIDSGPQPTRESDSGPLTGRDREDGWIPSPEKDCPSPQWLYTQLYNQATWEVFTSRLFWPNASQAATQDPGPPNPCRTRGGCQGEAGRARCRGSPHKDLHLTSLSSRDASCLGELSLAPHLVTQPKLPTSAQPPTV